MAGQVWTDDAALGAVDFEAVYLRYANESRVDKLFDELIQGIEQLLATGEIDSVRATRALEAVLATLRKNVRSAFYARYGAWEVASVYFRHFLWEALSGIPVLGVPVRALEKTMNELGDEMQKVQEAARREIGSQAAAYLPLLTEDGEVRSLSSGAESVVVEDVDPGQDSVEATNEDTP
jgi:hypothetical protein